MCHRTQLTPFVALFLAASACTTSYTAYPEPTPDPANVQIAQANLPRDPAASIPTAALTAAVQANNAFAVDLYTRARQSSSPTSNFLTSPISASLALTMTYAGAGGQTATQMATALHFGAAASSIFDGQNALSQALGARAAAALASDTQTATGDGQPAPSASDYQLQVVNSVWGEQTYTWNQPFLDTLAKSYGTGVRLEDFVNQPDPARQAINAWVSTETADKINDLLPPGSLDDTTRMVLVNAIHLKLPWANPFQVSETAPQTFTKAGGGTVSTPFMNQVLTTSYTDDGQAQIVGLPLAGGSLSVVIALPHGDLATYEASLGASSAALAQPTSSTLVSLALPKISFTSPTFSLAETLQAMGMTQAFDRTAADFKGLCTQPPDGDNLYIGDVLQKAMVAMQETGVEAAAATAVIVAGASVATGNPPVPVPVVLDRPFLLSIGDVPTGAVLFLGHIEDPTDAGGQ